MNQEKKQQLKRERASWIMKKSFSLLRIVYRRCMIRIFICIYCGINKNKSCTKCQMCVLLYVFRINSMDFSILKIPNKCRKKTGTNEICCDVGGGDDIFMTYCLEENIKCVYYNQSKNKPKKIKQIKWNRFAVFIVCCVQKKERDTRKFIIYFICRALACVRASDRITEQTNVCFVNCSFCTHVMWDQQLYWVLWPSQVFTSAHKHTHTHKHVNDSTWKIASKSVCTKK